MEKFIHVYLDREFAEEDRADYERHLSVCARCRRLARFEQSFKQQLKTSLGRPRLRLDEREEIRARIMRTIAEAPPLPTQRPARRWAMRLLPAAAAAGLLLALVLQQRDGRPPVVGTSIWSHSAATKDLEVKSHDPRKVRDWYLEKLGLAVDPPRFSGGHTALMGGRIGKVHAKHAAHLIYRRGDHKISVLVFRPENVPLRGVVRRRIGSKSIYFSVDGGQNVAAFRHRGVGYRITGARTQQELDALVRDVLYQPTTADDPAPVDVIPVDSPGGP